MFLWNEKVYNLPSKEEFLDLTNSLYDMIDALKAELGKPKDEELTQAHEKNERLRQQLSDLNRKSLIILTDEEYDRLEAWKREHEECVAKDLFSHRFCLEVKGREVRMFCSTCGGGVCVR